MSVDFALVSCVNVISNVYIPRWWALGHELYFVEDIISDLAFFRAIYFDAEDLSGVR